MKHDSEGQPIPIDAAKRIAKRFGYEQVVILARNTGHGVRGWITTYGINKTHCEVAARMGDHLRRLEKGELKLTPTGENDA